MNRLGRTGAGIFVAAGFALAVFLGTRHLLAAGAPAATPPVAVPELRGTGTLESVQEVPLGFKVAGRLEAVPFEEGAAIREGQVVARLDTRDLDERWKASRAASEAASASVRRAEADLAEAGAARERARADHERARQLFDEGVVGRADLDAARERGHVTEAAGDAARAAVTQAERAEAQAQRQQALERLNLDEGVLRSPVDGILTRRLKEPGNMVAAGTPVVTVISTRKLWVRAWMDESALGLLRIGQPAVVTLRSHPGRSFRGRVDRIGRQSDRQTHELLVDVEMLERPPLFAVGQRADVQVPLEGGPS